MKEGIAQRGHFLVVPMCLALSLAFGARSQANGGPTDSSIIARTGQPKLATKTNITLEEEFLHITLDGDFAEVHASYTFQNNGTDDIVEYAFPVEFLPNTDMYEGWQDECLPGFMMADESGIIPCGEVIDSAAGKIKLAGEEHDIHRKWYVAKLSFPAKSTKRLNVYYRVKSFLDDWGTNKTFFEHKSDRYFTYRLSPSGNWGSGKVKQFRLVIDATAWLPRGLKILKVGPYPFEDFQGTYYLEKSDFDLQGAPDLEIVYDTRIPSITGMCSRWRIGKDNVVVRTSSTLPGDYPSGNLLDGDFSTAWVEGAKGNGEGEWIELELDRINLYAIGIANGYMKSESLYLNNSRIKEAQIDITTTFPGGRVYKRTERMYFPERSLAQFLPRGYGGFLDIEDFGWDAYGTVKTKIRVTIVSVYPGRKWTDTCISEVFLMGGKTK